ncbi:plasmid pRiA4b ORF-3 family protein [Vicingaceae bacterium]|nr:plasmid pRiA4b ORF-3 family protein [Vicingaceae bacterium]
MSIYKFRVLLESKEDIFRDIEIKSTQTFDDLHQIILASYGFDNSQMAAFNLSNDEWEKGLEITLFDMQIDDNVTEKPLVMADTVINTQTNCVGAHLLYSYDFLNMRNFFIELTEITVKEDPNAFYPKVVYTQGEAPVQEKDMAEMTEEDMANELLKDAGFEEDGSDPSDIFEGFDDFDDFQ